MLAVTQYVHTHTCTHVLGATYTNRPGNGAKVEQKNDWDEEIEGSGATQETPSSQHLTVSIQKLWSSYILLLTQVLFVLVIFEQR